jgi:hypothetical protein
MGAETLLLAAGATMLAGGGISAMGEAQGAKAQAQAAGMQAAAYNQQAGYAEDLLQHNLAESERQRRSEADQLDRDRQRVMAARMAKAGASGVALDSGVVQAGQQAVLDESARQLSLINDEAQSRATTMRLETRAQQGSYYAQANIARQTASGIQSRLPWTMAGSILGSGANAFATAAPAFE